MSRSRDLSSIAGRDITANRPSSPVIGDQFFDTTLGQELIYTSTGWVPSIGGTFGTYSNPAPAITSLRNNGITTEGAYWFSTSKQSSPFQAYVKFNYIDGGDWALLLKVHNRADMPSGSTYWTNTTLNNASDFNLTSGNWAKYATWNGIPFTKLMMDMGGKIPPIMNFNQSKTMYEAIVASGASITGTSISGYLASSTDPVIGATGINYSAVTMKSGSNFTRQTGGAEPYMSGYGIGMFAGTGLHAITNTSDSAFGSLPTTSMNGAWIGSPLDDPASTTFLALSAGGADSGLGFGFNTGNVNRTGSAGYAEWASAAITDTLPGYVWVR